MLGLAAGLAFTRSNPSRVVVCNETGGGFAELTVSACGQSRTFRDVGYRESVRLKLTASGNPSEIAIATNGVACWRGDCIEPSGGYRAIVRIRRDGLVECAVTMSAWRRLF